MPSEMRVVIRTFDDIVIARRQGRELAAHAGFSNADLTLIATAISEISRNIVEYANGGEVAISLLSNGAKKGIKIVAADSGPGIPDTAKVMRDGYSSSKRLGIGLPGTNRLMDEFEIRSKIGEGTVVTMKKWVR